jgi:hypothetical protein
MASLRESDAEDSLNSALLGILLRRIRFSPNEKCSNLFYTDRAERPAKRTRKHKRHDD